MRRKMLHIALRILILLVVLVVVVRLFENKLVFHPLPIEAGVFDELTSTLPSGTGTFREVSIETADGVTISGWLGTPKHPRGTLLWLHGNAGNNTHRWPDFVEFVAGARLEVLLIDYRGFGASEGSPSEQGVYRDATAAWDYLMAHGATPGKTVILGRSLGGAVAVELASRTEPAGLILESTFFSLKEMIGKTIPVIPLHLAAKSRFPSDELIGDLDLPILFFHGTADSVVPFVQGRDLSRLAKQQRTRFIRVRGADHNDLAMTMGQTYFNEVSSFVESCIAGRGYDGD